MWPGQGRMQGGAIPPSCAQAPAVLPWISSCGTCPLQDTDTGVGGSCALSPLSADSRSGMTPGGGVGTGMEKGDEALASN